MSSVTARASLAAAVLAAALLSGCNVGRDDHPFVPQTKATPQAPVVNGAAPAVPVAPAAPVVSGSSEDQAPVAIGSTAQSGGASADPAVRRAVHQRAVARREAKEAKARERRAAKRAAKREAALRARLREARRQEAAAAAKQGQQEAAQQPQTSDNNKISASDVETQADRDRRSDMEARAAVVRYHELLDHHDATACDLLTPKLLNSFYGNPGAMERCRSGVKGISARVSVQIQRSAASGPHALLDTITYMGDTAVHQGLSLVLIDGTWKIDAVKRLDG